MSRDRKPVIAPPGTKNPVGNAGDFGLAGSGSAVEILKTIGTRLAARGIAQGNARAMIEAAKIDAAKEITLKEMDHRAAAEAAQVANEQAIKLADANNRHAITLEEAKGNVARLAQTQAQIHSMGLIDKINDLYPDRGFDFTTTTGQSVRVTPPKEASSEDSEGGNTRVSRLAAFGQGHKGAGGAAVVDPTKVPGAPSIPMVTVPAAQPETTTTTESSNESGIPKSTTEGNGTATVAEPVKQKDEKYGYFTESGDFETDPMKIAAAFTMKEASTRATGQPFSARFPFYQHPTSGVSIENISKLDETKVKPTLTPAIKVVYKGKDANRFGLEQQKPGAKYNQAYGYETQGEVRPRGFTWTGDEKTRFKHESSYFENLVMPAAIKIAEIHQKLNIEKNGGTSSIAAITDKNSTDKLQCSFCGTTAARDTSDPDTENDFIADHAILKNGWCRAAMLAHNAMHPIKGSTEEL